MAINGGSVIDPAPLIRGIKGLPLTLTLLVALAAIRQLFLDQLAQRVPRQFVVAAIGVADGEQTALGVIGIRL